MRFSKPKLSAVGMAAALVKPPEPKPLQVVEFSDIEREVAERLPLKAARRQVEIKLQAELEAALQVAVERHLGHAVTQPSEIMGRLSHAERRGGLMYFLDRTPVLWVGPVHWERKDDTVTGERLLQQIEAK